MKVVLISTYDLGRQPLGLSSPAAWLRERGHTVSCLDLAVSPLSIEVIRQAEAVAVHLPMHTATRLAVPVIARIRALNRQARLLAYGLYAPLNAEYLKSLGVETILGGEFEQALVDALERPPGSGPRVETSRARLLFRIPDRTGLPVLARYSKLRINGATRLVGYTETSRGCKHLCRHCPVPAVYDGVFRIIPADVVLEDIRRQVALGAQHITFGDPDFFNGPGHALRVLEAMHREFPQLSYDVTIKIQHLLAHRHLLPKLRDSGCLFITSAAESLDDAILEKLNKGHTRADFFEAVQLVRSHELLLYPTFVPFTLWTTREAYADLLETLLEWDLVDHVAPIQLALRLLIPPGSRLLELPEVLEHVTGFDPPALLYRWKHPDPGVDELAAQIFRLVSEQTRQGSSRRDIFLRIWEVVHGKLPAEMPRASRTTVPYLEEPWFC